MGDTLLSLLVAGGVAAWVYAKMGRRVGYGNSQSVWGLVGVAFVMAFLVVFSLLKWVLHLNG